MFGLSLCLTFPKWCPNWEEREPAWGHVPVWVRDVLPGAARPQCLPLGQGHGVAFRVRQAVWGAFTRKTCWVGLGEDNYWQWCAMKWQDESRILRALNLKWFFFHKLFIPFFCVNIFILLWSSNNIWIVTCAECMVGMYSLVGMSICIKRGSEPGPWVFSSYAQSTFTFTLFSNMGLFEICKRYGWGMFKYLQIFKKIKHQKGWCF